MAVYKARQERLSCSIDYNGVLTFCRVRVMFGAVNGTLVCRREDVAIPSGIERDCACSMMISRQMRPTHGMGEGGAVAKVGGLKGPRCGTGRKSSGCGPSLPTAQMRCDDRVWLYRGEPSKTCSGL